MAGEANMFNPAGPTAPLDLTAGQIDPNKPPPAPAGFGGPKLMDKDYLADSQPYMDDMRNQVQGGPQNNPWARYQMQQEGIRQAGDRDRLARSTMTSMDSQQGALAQSGGLNVGSVERLGRQNLMGQLQGQQALSRAAGSREAGIRSQAASRHDALAGRVGAAEMDRAMYKKDVDVWNKNQINKDNAAWHAANIKRDGGGGGDDESLTDKYWGYDTDQTRRGNFSFGGKYGVGISARGDSGPDSDSHLSIGGQTIIPKF